MTPGIDYSKPFLLACAFTLLGGFASAQIPTEGMFGVSIREQFYPVLGTGADTSLAVGMTISSYPDDTTLSVVREKLSGLAEVDRLKVPEYLLLRELDLVAKGEKEAIVDLYHGDESKNFARNERWRDMEYSTSFARNKVDHYLLETKAHFGPFVRIRYKPVVKDGVSIGGAVVMREIEGAYLFSEELGREHLFQKAAEAYPYWGNTADRNNTGDLTGFKKASFFYDGVAGVSVVKSAPIHVYCKWEPVWEQAFPDVEVKSGIESKLSLLLEGYKTTTPEKIAQAWAPSQRASVLKRLQSDPIALKKDAAMFEASTQIKPIYLVRAGSELLVYAVSVDSSIANRALHLFRFEKEGGEYFLGENARLGTPFPAAILRSKEMIATVGGWIQESNIPDLGR
jgi:hypothetical protein